MRHSLYSQFYDANSPGRGDGATPNVICRRMRQESRVLKVTSRLPLTIYRDYTLDAEQSDGIRHAMRASGQEGRFASDKRLRKIFGRAL